MRNPKLFQGYYEQLKCQQDFRRESGIKINVTIMTIDFADGRLNFDWVAADPKSFFDRSKEKAPVKGALSYFKSSYQT